MSTEHSPADRTRVRELLGREPQGRYTVAARDADGDPTVIRNAPLLDDGTPMPTLYWLIGPDEVRRMGQLEAQGGVDAAEAAVDPVELAEAHDRYAAERDADIDPEHTGPRPSGGVGGTRIGVKCLHAHRAWQLAGGDDPVGRWIDDQLHVVRFDVDDDRTTVTLTTGATATIPWGARTLTVAWLASSDPPDPSALTNALGSVDDHLDDVEREHPSILDTAQMRFAGPTIRSLAAVELGRADPDHDVVLVRSAAEEIFRIVATEAAGDRAHNPGLPFEHVDTIVAACCIVLAVMRRFRLDHVTLG